MDFGGERSILRGRALKFENNIQTLGAEPERSNIYTSKKNENN
jgi:hypothetical protein